MPDSIEFVVPVADEAVKDILIAKLVEAGADGFQEEKGILKIFSEAGKDKEEVFDKIIKENNLAYSKSVIKDQNWNKLWEADFHPVHIGNFCTIRAGFHPPDKAVQHDIVITPKMSFGTGHHATTRLMVEAMERIDFTGKMVFDFGTGTGVLSVLAEQCGAAAVVAIDNDDWSITNAIENFKGNNCSKVLTLKQSGFIDAQKYDIVLANINRNIILQEMAAMQQHLVKNGVVLLSGLLEGDEQIIVAEASRHSFELIKKTEMNGWICLLMASR